MSTPSQVGPPGKALFMVGGVLSSGDVNTGEYRHVRGGGRAATIWSGALFSGTTISTPPGSVPISNGGDILLYSGAGRLNSILIHTQMVSGLTAFFYDSAVAVSGGPIATSGHKIVGAVPPTYAAGAVSGTGYNLFGGNIVNVDMPFQSGLCVNVKSGVPGFTVSFTPEVDYQGAPFLGA